MSKTSNVIESKSHHLWTDALHGRELAREAANKWDRGTYVRWCTMSAWAVLENACIDVTGDTSVSYKFKVSLNNALKTLSLTEIDWGQGIWQKVLKVQKWRKYFVHRFTLESVEFPPIEHAEEVVIIIRSAVKDIYRRCNKVPPNWIDSDESKGWDRRGGFSAHAQVIRDGARQCKNPIRIAVLKNGREYDDELIPETANWKEAIEQIVSKTGKPISEVRVYQNEELIHKEVIQMRGN